VRRNEDCCDDPDPAGRGVSLLLKALKQAETAHAEKTAAPGADMELESMAPPDAAKAREWLEPPGMLFGSSGVSPTPAAPSRGFRMPNISLVPATGFIFILRYNLPLQSSPLRSARLLLSQRRWSRVGRLTQA